MKGFRFNSYLCLLSTLVFSYCQPAEKASLVILNGKVVTVNNNFDVEEAVACSGDKIIFVGTSSDAEEYIGENTTLIDLQGKMVLPGLIDGQGHMFQLGAELTYLDIDNTASYEELVDLVKERVKKTLPGDWIIGGRWDQNNWDTKEFPSHEKLSSISPENPVFLHRVDGYAALVNQKALQIAGLNKNTPEPFGGKILRNSNNEPTGILINRAMNLVKNFLPAETDSSYKKEVLLAVDNCLKTGLTSWHEIGATPYEIGILKELVDNNQLKMRGVMFVGSKEDPVIEGDLEKYFGKYKLENYGNYNLSVKGIQLHFDGALGSRGAALYNPYNDDPSNIGLLRIPPQYIYEVAAAGLKLGMIVNTSCIGTRGNNLCLNMYEKALKDFPAENHRLRITHAQVLLPEDIPRFSEMGIIPSMQPIHATSDKRFVEYRIGKDRMAGAYAWRSILDNGSIVVCGSDFPVEPNNPFLGMYSAVTRKDKNGNPEGGFYPEQSITIEEVIKGYTIWAAYSVYQENLLGSIDEGKLADFTIISNDILQSPPENLLETEVIYTIVGGKIVHSAN